MKRFKSLGFFIFCCFVLVATGCGLNGNSREFTLFGKGVNIAGANQPFLESIEKFDDARLVAVLDPDDKLNLGKEILKEKTLTALDLERAFYKADGYDKKGIHWNRIQERLILASQQACNFYKDYLRRIDSYESFLLGGLSTVLGGASAIVTGRRAPAFWAASVASQAALMQNFLRLFSRMWLST